MLLIGIISMCFILVGYLQKSRKLLHLYAFIGSIGLVIYSCYLGDIVFIILNSILGITNLIKIIKGE